MRDWDKVSKPASADWSKCSLPAKADAQQRRAERSAQRRAMVEAKDTKLAVLSDAAYGKEMASVQEEIDIAKREQDTLLRTSNHTERSYALVAHSEEYEITKKEQDLAVKKAEDARLQQEAQHQAKIESDKRASLEADLQRRQERHALRDSNLRTAMRVDTTKSYSKKALIVGGTAWMLFKVAANFDALFLPDGHQHNAPKSPVPEQGVSSPQQGADQGQPITPPAAKPPEFIPGQGKGAGYEQQPEGKVKGKDGEIYEHSAPSIPFEHSGEGKSKKAENPEDWGWDNYFPPQQLKAPGA